MKLRMCILSPVHVGVLQLRFIRGEFLDQAVGHYMDCLTCSRRFICSSIKNYKDGNRKQKGILIFYLINLI